jgi:hypothetical protein
MATTAVPRVDIGALAGSIASEVHDRLSISAQWCDEDDSPRLTEIQQATLLRSLFSNFDGLEVQIARQIKRDLEEAGVETWGLDTDLEDLLRADPEFRRFAEGRDDA